jgi:hypothetical protein
MFALCSEMCSREWITQSICQTDRDLEKIRSFDCVRKVKSPAADICRE